MINYIVSISIEKYLFTPLTWTASFSLCDENNKHVFT